MAESVRILGIGVATMDIYVNQGRMYPGGNEYNIACHAQNCGAEAGFLGVFADDKAGEILEQTLVQTSVDCSYSHHEKGSSGYSLVELMPDGDRVFLDWNKAGVTDIYPIEFNAKELKYVRSFDVSCLGRCASVSLDKIKYLYENGVDLCYDFHATFDDEEIDRVAPYVRYAFFSCSHLEKPEIEKFLKRATDNGCEIAVGTRGSECLYAYDGSTLYEQEPFKVEARDALGAGDSFIASFLSNYLSHANIPGMSQYDNIKESLVFAARYAAKVVLMDGSIGIYFDLEPDKIPEVINISDEALIKIEKYLKK